MPAMGLEPIRKIAMDSTVDMVCLNFGERLGSHFGERMGRFAVQ